MRTVCGVGKVKVWGKLSGTNTLDFPFLPFSPEWREEEQEGSAAAICNTACPLDVFRNPNVEKNVTRILLG